MTWVRFGYGGVICTPQPDRDVAALAAVAGVSVADFTSGIILTPGLLLGSAVPERTVS